MLINYYQRKMQQERKYKKIVIQQLEHRPQLDTKQTSQKELFINMNRRKAWLGKPYHLYRDSGLNGMRILQRNGIFSTNHFFNAFYHAYTKHGDILLIPDQIWIMITFYVSTYIDKNAQKLRSKLVLHEGQETINIIQYSQNTEQSLLAQENWDNFFEQMIEQIAKKTVGGVVDTFACDFSTTTDIYRLISTSIVMNSLKTFFKYKRSICACGINNVYMGGVREDWEKMIHKLEDLIRFDIDGELKKYIDHMKVILVNFLNTFDQHPNVQWWNCVMKSPQKRRTYGGQQTDVDGWILNFFGKYQKQTLISFPAMCIQVPITLVNQLTHKQKQLVLVADWVSNSKPDERTYKPDVGICIVQLKQNQLQKK